MDSSKSENSDDNWIWIQEVFVKDNIPESVCLPNVPKDYQELCKYMGDYSIVDPVRNSQPRPGEYYKGTPKVGTHIYGRNLKGESCCIVIKDNTIALRFKKPVNVSEEKVKNILKCKNTDFDLTPNEINVKQKYEIFGYQPDPNDITKRRKVPVMELRYTSISKMRRSWKKLCDDQGIVDINDRTDAKNNDFGVWFLVERNPTPPSSWINLKNFSTNTNFRYTVCVHECESFIKDIDWNPKNPPPIPIPKSICCSWDTEWSSRSRHFPSSRRDYPALVGALVYDTSTSPNDKHLCVIFSCRNSDQIPPIGDDKECKVQIRQYSCPELMLIAFRDFCVLESDSLFIHGYNSDKFDFRWCSEYINECCNLRPEPRIRDLLWSRSPVELIAELGIGALELSAKYFALSREPCPPSLLAVMISHNIEKLKGDSDWDTDIPDDKRYSTKKHFPPYILKCSTLKKYHTKGHEAIVDYVVKECFWWFETVTDWHEEWNSQKMKQIYSLADSDINQLAKTISSLFPYQRLKDEPQWNDIDRHPFFYWSKIVTLYTPLRRQTTMIAKREAQYYKIVGPGIIFYDLLTYAMNEIKDLKEFSLEALCRREGIEGKADFDVRVGFEIIERNRPKEMAEYVYYNYVDCLRPAQITHKRGFYLFHSVLSNITFTPLQKVFSNGASARVHDQIMRDLETKDFVDDMPRSEPPPAIFGFNYSEKKEINPRTQNVELLYILKIIGMIKSNDAFNNYHINDDEDNGTSNKSDEKMVEILKKLPIDSHLTWAHKLNKWSKKGKRTALIFESDIVRTAQLFIERFGFKERAKGGNVFPPTPGYYRQPIATLDFTSLYPSVMLAFNLCYTTLVKDPQVIEKALEFEKRTGIKIIYAHKIRDDRIHYFMKSPDTSIQFNSVIPSLLRNLLIARKKVKAELEDEKDPYLKMILDTKQLVIKICANSVYGFTGFMNGVLPCLEITETVTLNGRNMILACQNWIETREWKKFLYDAMLIDASKRLMLEIQNSSLVVGRTKDVVFSFDNNVIQPNETTLQVWKNKIQDKINKPDADTDCKDLQQIQEWITDIKSGANPLSKFLTNLRESYCGDQSLVSATENFLCQTNLNYQFLKRCSPKSLESLKDLINFQPLLTERKAKVVYGDTDSVMIDFGCHPDVNGRKVAFLLGFITSRNRTLTFCEQFATTDINLDLEKVSQPFYLMKKKRYISLEFVGGPLKKPKSNVRGTEEVRKDNCALVVRLQKICRGFITEDKVDEIVPYLKKEMNDVIMNPPNGIPVYHDFKMSKSLKEKYANPNGVVQLQVNEKIRKRNPGAEYKTGDRVEFIYPKGDQNLASSKRAEHYQYVVDNRIEIDYLYYLDQIIIRAMFRLLQYAVPQIVKVAFSDVRAFAERHRTGEVCLKDSIKFLNEDNSKNSTLAFKPLPIIQPKSMIQRKRQINQLSIISNPVQPNKRQNTSSTNKLSLSKFF